MSKLTDEQVAEGLLQIQGGGHVPGDDGLCQRCDVGWPCTEALALALQEKLQAAEAERDEARQQRQMWVDIAQRMDAAFPGKIAEARREAFEEAAKLRCYRCRQGVPVRLAPGGPSKLFWHDLPGGDVVVCESGAVRALAEVER